MGFKADASFLRFLTMGACGVKATVAHLGALGFRPIELERYCSSNKIWATKVKRLRLPDLLCVKTGLRIEVRAKSDLAIKMSDAPANPDRVWDAGMRDDDLAAFIACFNDGDGPEAADCANFFRIGDLRKSIVTTKLGPPKSASEGAERDRQWPTTVPKRNGKVVEVTRKRIVTKMYATSTQPERQQTYQLKNKTAYVEVGDEFKARTCFLSGTPKRTADLNAYLANTYDPLSSLLSSNIVDRYAAAKSLPHREENRKKAAQALEGLIGGEPDSRVRLEAAGSATYFGSRLGRDAISEFIWSDRIPHELRLEAVLVLIELGRNNFTNDILCAVAGYREFFGNEIRQVAVWGLGKRGIGSYEELLHYIADAEENVALHAIAAFGDEAPPSVVARLVERLTSGDERLAPAASEALRVIGSRVVIDALVEAYGRSGRARAWILATLGRMPPNIVRTTLGGHHLLKLLEPMFLTAPSANWLSSEKMAADIGFLLAQNL